MFGLLIGLLTMAAAQDASPCAEPATSADLLGSMEVAENAWSMADAAGFEGATISLASLLPCVQDPITRATAARIHRVRGMNHFLKREKDDMQLSFAAARYVQPGWNWPADLVPPDHPVHKQYVAKSIDDASIERTQAPKEGVSWYDGRESLDRPTDWPTIHQTRADDGSILGTWLIMPGDTLPDYPRLSPAASETLAVGGEKKGFRLPMLIGAGTGFVASGVLYGLAASSSGTYHSGGNQSADELDQLRKATNGRYWASVGLAGASSLTTIGAFAVTTW